MLSRASKSIEPFDDACCISAHLQQLATPP
jgi:hypothetical protein